MRQRMGCLRQRWPTDWWAIFVWQEITTDDRPGSMTGSRSHQHRPAYPSRYDCLCSVFGPVSSPSSLFFFCRLFLSRSRLFQVSAIKISLFPLFLQKAFPIGAITSIQLIINNHAGLRKTRPPGCPILPPINVIRTSIRSTRQVGSLHWYDI